MIEMTSRQDEPVGFAGLTSLVTRLSEVPRPAATNRTAHEIPEREESQPTASTASSPNAHKGDDQRAKRRLDGNWIAIAAVAGGILIVGALNLNGQKPQYTGSPTQYQQSIPSNPTSVADTKPTLSVPAYAPQRPPVIVEEKPNIPNDSVEPVLYRNQIYYCLVEKARINILRKHTEDTSDQEIKAFNDRAHDYNARCSNFKYYPREMDAAKRQYDAEIGAISAQFTARLIPASKLPQPSPTVGDTPPSIIAPTPAASPTGVRTAPSAQIAEVMPPYGQGHRHNRENLYYCFAESERLAWARKAIDMTSQRQADALGKKTDDFNARCTHFNSDAADRDAVKKQFAANRAVLKAQGIAMAKSWR